MWMSGSFIRSSGISDVLRCLRFGLIALIVGLAAAACSGVKEPAPSVILGFSPVDIRYDFTPADTSWDVFTAPAGEALFRLQNGVLEGAVIPDRGYVWSLANRRYNDVSIRARVQQMEGIRGNGFGVMCRADEAGNGYYFLISSAGQYALLKATPQDPNPQPLNAWTSSEWIRPGAEPNDLEATCVNDRLIFMVNGHFLAEVRDAAYSVGEPGVVLGAVQDTLWVQFDDIDFRLATIAGMSGR